MATSRVGFSGGPSGHSRRGCGRQTCQMCIAGAKWLPVILIMAIVSWSYYAYIVHLCVFTVLNEAGTIEAIILATIYHLFLVPFIASYWKTVWTHPGKVPRSYALTTSEVDIIESASEPRRALENLVASKDLAVSTRSMQGEIRYCSECSHIKPDRCHHCSMCNECVLKMDHHCPWVNNCVGYYNQKFFFLFLGYAFFYCMYVMLSTLKYFIAYWSHDAMTFSNGKFHVIFLFFVSGMFAVSLLSLFGYHIYLISQNRTTLEAFRPPFFRSGSADRKGFFLGKGNNFREVLGDRPMLWFVPVFTSLGDGLTFPRQGMDEEEGYSDGYESDLNNRGDHGIHRQLNRRFQSLNTNAEETSDDPSDADENVLLLPPKNNSSFKSWQENERSEVAETSPDSLADVRFSDYSSKFGNGGAAAGNGTVQHMNQS